MPPSRPPLPSRMRAAVCDGHGGVRVESVPRPRVRPGEVLLRVRCAGLCGTDLWKLATGGAPSGSVLGHEVVGTVEALGGIEAPRVFGGTRPLAVGDRVVAVHHVACGACPVCLQGSETMCGEFRRNLLAPGGFAEWLVVRRRAVASGLFRLPRRVGDEAAVFLEPTACVLRGLARAGLARIAAGAGSGSGGAPRLAPEAAGATVAILGAGSMGLLHLLVLRALDGSQRRGSHPPRQRLKIVVVDPLARRRALARRLGADAAATPGADARRRLAALSAHGGADAVFDTVGGAAVLRQALELGRPGSTVVLFAHAATAAGAAIAAAAELPLNLFFKTERRLIATYSSGAAEQRAACRLLAGGRLDPAPLVTHRLPLAAAPAAVALAASRRALKAVLLPGEPAAAGRAS